MVGWLDIKIANLTIGLEQQLTCPLLHLLGKYYRGKTQWERKSEREKERERERKRDRETETERQRQRQTDRQTARETDRETETERDTERERQTDRQTNRQTHRHTDRQRQETNLTQAYRKGRIKRRPIPHIISEGSNLCSILIDMGKQMFYF